MVQVEDLMPKTPRVQGKQPPVIQEISKDDLLLAQLAENMPSITTVEDVLKSESARDLGYAKQDDQHAVSIRHVRPGRIIMFKVDNETGRIFRKVVPASNLLENRKNGWLSVCPECHTDCSHNPNECPTRLARGEFRMNTSCPVCHKAFYDPGPLPKGVGAAEDPGSVNFDDFDDSPQLRLKGMRDDHIRAVHTTIARRMGLFTTVIGEK